MTLDSREGQGDLSQSNCVTDDAAATSFFRRNHLRWFAPCALQQLVAAQRDADAAGLVRGHPVECRGAAMTSSARSEELVRGSGQMLTSYYGAADLFVVVLNTPALKPGPIGQPGLPPSAKAYPPTSTLPLRGVPLKSSAA